MSFQSRDEKQQFEIQQNTGGLYFFTVQELLTEPASNGLDAYDYWSETIHSGLYSSRTEAFGAAFTEIPWLSVEYENQP